MKHKKHYNGRFIHQKTYCFHFIKKNLLLSTLIFFSVFSQALLSDREQPIQIKSNRANIDNKTGTTIYEGAVVMTQGSIHISGDQVSVYSVNKKIQKIITKGFKERASYKEEQPDSQGTLQAWACTIEYLVVNDTIRLIKQAQLIQHGDTLKGEQIDYNLHLKNIHAHGSGKETDPEIRVQMILQPKRSKKR